MYRKPPSRSFSNVCRVSACLFHNPVPFKQMNILLLPRIEAYPYKLTDFFPVMKITA